MYHILSLTIDYVSDCVYYDKYPTAITMSCARTLIAVYSGLKAFKSKYGVGTCNNVSTVHFVFSVTKREKSVNKK